MSHEAETRREGRHDILVSTLTLTQCDPPPLKNPGYAPIGPWRGHFLDNAMGPG